MTPRRLAAIVLVSLTGCATPAWHNVDPARNTRAAFNWDQDDCRRGSLYRNAHPRWGENPLYPYLVVDEAHATQCMEARGWRQGAQ